MSEAFQERKIPELATELDVVAAGENLSSRYANVYWLVDFEGVLLPKSFRGLEKASVTSHHEDDITAIERGVYRLPVNQKLIDLLEKLLKADPKKNWLVEGSSLVSIPEPEIQRHIPAFRFGIQRSREVLDNLAERTLGKERHIKPGSMPYGSLLVVLNDEIPPMGLYKHIKGQNAGNFDSYDICEVPLSVYTGQNNGEYFQNTLDTMLKAFKSPVIKRVVEASKTTLWSTGSGLASLAPRGVRIRREGD